ncbi:MAG: CBS domain-containing protein [Anaerolineales bacterium]|nr:MAG: CBS domain-containing protein [Anaerolineales bacterium]
MSHVLVVILDDLKRMPDLIEAWHAIGVPGVTILESVGGYRASTWLRRVGLGALDRLFEAEEVRRRTLLVAIEEDELLERAIAEADRVMGGFDRPNSGVLLALPVVQSRGLRKVQRQEREQELPPAVWPGWAVRRHTPIKVVNEILALEPTIVRPQTSLETVARAMMEHCNVHVVCVVDDHERLIGLIGLRRLADDLFFHIMPEEFMSEITDLERALEYANKSRMRTAADAMQEPVWVKPEETVKDAFKRMHENRLSGLPVVDDLYHVVGYINLLELMAVCTEYGDETSEAGEGEP